MQQYDRSAKNSYTGKNVSTGAVYISKIKPEHNYYYNCKDQK